MNQKKWDKRFLELCRLISSWSKDISTKVGSVIVDSDNRIVSLGYNGFPKGFSDDEFRYNNRFIKYKYVVHAERNAIIFAKQNLKDCTIYTWPMMPCTACAGMIIQSGIKRVVSIENDNERWADDFSYSTVLFKESGIDLEIKNISDLD